MTSRIGSKHLTRVEGEEKWEEEEEEIREEVEKKRE